MRLIGLVVTSSSGEFGTTAVNEPHASSNIDDMYCVVSISNHKLS